MTGVAALTDGSAASRTIEMLRCALHDTVTLFGKWGSLHSGQLRCFAALCMTGWRILVMPFCQTSWEVFEISDLKTTDGSGRKHGQDARATFKLAWCVLVVLRGPSWVIHDLEFQI